MNEKMSIVASWKIDGFYKADASKVAAEISSLGENFTTQEIVEKARSTDSELHKCFEWNDSIAAEKYRLTQAQNILRLLVVTKNEVDREPQKTNLRVFHSDGMRKNSYSPIQIIVKKNDEYEVLLNNALAELKSFKKKYHMLSELEEILALID